MPLVVAVWLAFVTPPDPETTSEPIVGGELAPGDGAVVSLRVGGVSRCSGVLIGPRTVLSAAHCSALFEGDNEVLVYFEPGESAPAFTVPVAARHVHPLWRERMPPHDLMLLELAEPVPGVTPVRLYPKTVSDLDVGRGLRVVGFGVSAPSAGPGANGNGTRREATLTVRQVLPYQLEAGGAATQSCVGDSGGPGFFEAEGAEWVAVTVSGGGRACDESGFYARINLDTAWILTTAAAWDPITTCGRDGQCLDGCGSLDPDCPVGPQPDGGCSTTGALTGVAALALALWWRFVRRR